MWCEPTVVSAQYRGTSIYLNVPEISFMLFAVAAKISVNLLEIAEGMRFTGRNMP